MYNQLIGFFCITKVHLLFTKIKKSCHFLTCSVQNHTHKRNIDNFVSTSRQLSLKVKEGIKNSEVGSSFSHVTITSVR